MFILFLRGKLQEGKYFWGTACVKIVDTKIKLNKIISLDICNMGFLKYHKNQECAGGRRCRTDRGVQELFLGVLEEERHREAKNKINNKVREDATVTKPTLPFTSGCVGRGMQGARLLPQSHSSDLCQILWTNSKFLVSSNWKEISKQLQRKSALFPFPQDVHQGSCILGH